MNATVGQRTEIHIESLHKAFGAHRVLQGIDMDIHAGDVLAVVGGSGCGKTVLLNHILGQMKPDAGLIQVADHDLPGAPLIDLADIEPAHQDLVHQHWGMVFQRNALFSGSVFDNIALWLQEIRNMDDDDITPIAHRVLRAVALPDDDQFLLSDAESLSGGMAKRLAVARALAMNPIVIFYDEPTTGLDPTSATQIQDLIAETHQEDRPGQPSRTTVIITHDKDLLRRLEPRTVMLHEGRVYFDGPYGDFEKSTSPIIRPYFDQMPTLHMTHRN
jgi:phospholipid/cholesterol/gamma-HCH transport system ATP-binding protein